MKTTDKLIEKLKRDLVVYMKGYKIESTFTEEEINLIIKVLESEQIEEVETFRKVYIKSESDLPKEDGDYIVKYNDGSIETFPFKLDEAHWFTHIDWYLLPVSSLQSSEPENNKTDEEIGQMANEQVSLYLKARNNPTQDLYKRFVNMAKWALKHSETIK